MRLSAQPNNYIAALTQLPLDVEVSVAVTAVDKDSLGAKNRAIRDESRRSGEKDRYLCRRWTVAVLKLPPKARKRGSRVSIGPGATRPPEHSSVEVTLLGPFRVASDQTEKLAAPRTLIFRLPHERRRQGTKGYDTKSFKILEYDSASRKWIRHDATLYAIPLDLISLKLNAWARSHLSRKRSQPQTMRHRTAHLRTKILE